MMKLMFCMKLSFYIKAFYKSIVIMYTIIYEIKSLGLANFRVGWLNDNRGIFLLSTEGNIKNKLLFERKMMQVFSIKIIINTSSYLFSWIVTL